MEEQFIYIGLAAAFGIFYDSFLSLTVLRIVTYGGSSFMTLFIQLCLVLLRFRNLTVDKKFCLPIYQVHAGFNT